ncbi:MAG: hypothetical protein M3R08_04900 [Bacteroidota bacterium]|nr:hypothetical protein [Bacteroidota bacterium]
MIRTLFLLVTLVHLVQGNDALAQGAIRDSSIALIAVSANYAYQIPSGDISLRFGHNHNVGLSALRKEQSNYMYGVEGGFIFGSKVIEPGFLRDMVNSQGQIVDRDGQMADVLIFERGYSIFLVGGKIIPVAGPNKNSGMLLKIGGGYMRHKIRIQTQKNDVPQLEGDYLEGYDRLAAGPAAMLYFGYQHFSNTRKINFNIGFEMQLGFTEPLRAFNFDTRTTESGRRFDGLTGIRAGWTIPIYKRIDDRFHYN